ncbi:MAG: hypothetical protein PHQ05_04915 [Sterolibacterium sp.]|nr:hypothetical protein [Sterolibacterium sp.]
MKMLLPLLIVLLAGCVTLPPAPVVTEVDIPIGEKCEAPVPKQPSFAVDALPIGADIYAQTKALRAERQQRKGYEHELEAAVKACR